MTLQRRTRHDGATVASRLADLEAQASARWTIARCMALCDVPAPHHIQPGELEALFAPDAVWESVGADTAHATIIVRYEGRAAIGRFLRGHPTPSPNLRRKVHFLAGEAIDATGSAARGQWVLQQIAIHRDGGTELVSARLTVEFIIEDDGTCLIQCLRSERLASVPLDTVPAPAPAPDGTEARP